MPTIYDMLGIRPPKVVNGFEQLPIDGSSLAYTFADPKAANRKQVQFFDNNGSRGLYEDGWFAGTFGPFIPVGHAGLRGGSPPGTRPRTAGSSTTYRRDFSQAHDLAATIPRARGDEGSAF